MTRVLLVGKGAPERGGIPATLQMVQTSRLSQRHDLRLANLSRPEPPREGGRFTAGNVRRTAEDAARLWREACDVDVVDIHTAFVPLTTLFRAWLLALVARLRGASVVVHAHGGLIRTWVDGPVRRLLVRAAMTPVRTVVAVSDGERAALVRALPADRVRLIRNGVDTAVFRPPDQGRQPGRRPVVLYVGLLTPRKGVVDLLRASEELTERGVDHELRIVGGTPDEGAHAEREVRDAAGPEVRFLGTQPHEAMADHYRAADVFCLPSWWEAMPLSILEAMASGLPVVATDVGDVPHVVADGRTGLLVPPREPRALAEALATVLRDGDRREAMGTAGRRLAEERFSLDRTVDELDALFRAVAS